jgi:hypothetical protein
MVINSYRTTYHDPKGVTLSQINIPLPLSPIYVSNQSYRLLEHNWLPHIANPAHGIVLRRTKKEKERSDGTKKQTKYVKIKEQDVRSVWMFRH